MLHGECRPHLILPLALSLGALPLDLADSFVTVARADVHTRRVDRSAIAISANGRYIAFSSYARLHPDDSNNASDLYVLDRETGIVSLEPAPSQGELTADVTAPSLSADGRLLVFGFLERSSARRMVALRDRLGGATRVPGRDGIALDGDIRSARLSGNGEVLVFSSSATNVVDGPDANGHAEDVYVAEVASMRFERISVDDAGRQPDAGASFDPTVSVDGRFIAFTSTAPVNGVPQGRRTAVYLRDRHTGTTKPVCVGVDTAPANGSCYEPAINANGRYIAFVSDATNLAKGRDDNRSPDVFVRDTLRNVTELISRGADSKNAGNGASLHPAISSDGRFVVFQSEASDLVCARRCPAPDRDINLVADIFVRDRLSGTTRRVSRAREPWMEPSLGPAIDGSGAVIAFSSQHPTDSGDDREDYDLFVWTRDF